MFKNKKAEAHHYMGMVIAFILGMLVMYLMATGVIEVPISICAVAP